MDIAIAQTELRRAYLRGGPGAIVSGVVWLAAGITAARHGVPAGFEPQEGELTPRDSTRL